MVDELKENLEEENVEEEDEEEEDKGKVEGRV